jgi:hypothetical protein
MTPETHAGEKSEGLPEDLKGSDHHLMEEALNVVEERRSIGLEGLVGGLQAVIINTEPYMQRTAVKELLRYTGMRFQCAFQDSGLRTCVLRVPGSPSFRSADILITSRLRGESPFVRINAAVRSRHLPGTRLETFVFETVDIDKYFSIQRSLGVKVLTNDIIDEENFLFIQTEPSVFTGNSIGIIQWKCRRGDYATANSTADDWFPEKPELDYLKNIRWIDHTATRVKAQDRDAAIIEFMKLTNYKFNFAIYVRDFNSITSVARLSHSDYAAVFTSGIVPYISDKVSGPTERFIQNYGTRVHHMAFQTENIEETYQSILEDGMRFLIELIGSPEEGLKQTFTKPSKNTLLVNEYIHRYDNFDGFFTRSNVTLLTEATGKQ